MEWNKKYSYPSSTRAIVNGSRHYSMDGFNLPSVTTILAATKSEEDKAAIAAWKERVGHKEAERIKNEASSRGNSMHSYIEQFLLGKMNLDLYKHLSFGSRALFSGIFLEINSRVDILVLAYFLDDSSVGIYSCFAVIGEGIYNLFVVIKNNFSPKLVKLYS